MDGRETDAPFRAALYMRLSRDDEGGGESASISTQREAASPCSPKSSSSMISILFSTLEIYSFLTCLTTFKTQ